MWQLLNEFWQAVGWNGISTIVTLIVALDALRQRRKEPTQQKQVKEEIRHETLKEDTIREDSGSHELDSSFQVVAMEKEL